MTARQRFAVVLATLAEVFRVDVTESLAEAYWRALREWPIESLEAGGRVLIASARFFPRPVEWGDAADAWLHDRQVSERRRRLALAVSTEPPMKAEEIRALVGELGEKLGWNPQPLTPEEVAARRRQALDQAKQLLTDQGDGQVPRA